MNAKTILVATDFSPSAEAALDCASLLADELRASLLIVHVKPTPLISAGEDDVFDPHEPDLHEQLKATRPTESRVPFDHHFLHGNPAHEIQRLAEHENVDLIVMGAHGTRVAMDTALGTVAKEVVLHAKAPVLTFSAPRRVAAPIT